MGKHHRLRHAQRDNADRPRSPVSGQSTSTAGPEPRRIGRDPAAATWQAAGWIALLPALKADQPGLAVITLAATSETGADF
ncbi:MAG: hypothetical protein WDN49_27630 [Acetobacteraceae bacterium]